MSVRRHIPLRTVGLLLAGSLTLASWSFSRGQVKAHAAGAMIEERMLHAIGPGKYEGAINVRVGDVIQLNPFRLPVTPKFLDAELKVEAQEDRVIDVIGQRPTPSTTEGRSGRSVFLFVQREGRTTVAVSLVDDKGRPIEGYRRTYTVVANAGG